MKSFKFFIFLTLALALLIVIVLAVLGIPPVQSGPGALSVLGAIPNLVVIGFSLIALVIILFALRRGLPVSNAMWRNAFIAYGIIAILLCTHPQLWGSYSLRVEVVDDQGKPIPGIGLDSLSQKADLSPLSIFLREDVKEFETTDEKGMATFKANRFKHVGILVNMRYGPGGGGRPSDEGYRFTDVQLKPIEDRKVEAGVSWSSASELPDNSNMRMYESAPFEPTSTVLTVFLPKRKGTDHFNYPAVLPGKFWSNW